MPSEPSLYERLREAADLPKEARDHWIVLHYNIESTERIVVLTSERLAAIERDMLAPLRDENAALRRAGHTLREAAVKAWIIEDSAALYDAINVWDATVDPEVAKEFPGILAADRAGETPTPKQIEALDDLADDAIRAHHAGETVNIRDITPSPTDAAAKDEDYEPNILIKGKTVAKLKCFDEKTLSGLVESIPDLERWAADTSNELASIREWQAGHQERLADLERWREGVDQKLDRMRCDIRDMAILQDIHSEQHLDALRGPEVTRPTPEDLQGDAEWPPEHRDAAILNYLYKTTRGDSWPYLSKASLNVILGAVRNWEHEHSEGVTDEMILAYWEATSNGNNRIHPESPIGLKVRAGLAAALRAGGGSR